VHSRVGAFAGLDTAWRCRRIVHGDDAGMTLKCNSAEGTWKFGRVTSQQVWPHTVSLTMDEEASAPTAVLETAAHRKICLVRSD
jgi:hypothetical protein